MTLINLIPLKMNGNNNREGVHYEKTIKASFSFINSKDHCDSNDSAMHFSVRSDDHRDRKRSIRHSRGDGIDAAGGDNGRTGNVRGIE